MRKSLVMLIVSSLVLAGCAGMSEDDAKEIAEELVDIPGCNDETAYNYDETATNANACYTEAILKDAVADFILFIDQGPAWGETGGLTTEGSEVDEDGEMTTFSTTMAMSPDGIYVMTEMNEGMMQFSMGELVTENSENGKTNIQSTWMGTTFMMHSDSTFAEHWNEVSFNENNADSDEDADSEDDMEMGDDEMDMGMPNTEVDIPEDFDPATALYEAGLATDNGYSFTTTIDHGEGYSTSMTFTLTSMFEVTKVVMEETDSEGMVSTSSITVLTSAEVDALLDDDENLVQHALPFVLNPMGPMMDMVCYDMNSHQIMMQIDNQDDCENGGYMWVPANSGPGGDGDGNGDGHNHGGDNDNDGFTVAQGDCDDSNSDVYPGAPEIQNGIDDDCDNEVDEGDDTMTISGYLTDNWASSDEMYVDPEFTISSGFENIDNVNFELTDDEGSTLMDITIQPSDFIDTGNDIMLYFVPITDLMLDNGCYVLTATANTINGYELSWERGDICYDYSGDGGITAEEFMQLTDTDGSSTMTFEEFVNFFESEELMSEEMESDFSIMFADSDTDGSNDLDISELQFFVDELDNYMDSMEDGDGDGHDHGDWPTFVCGDGEEIPFEYVNDGEEDCTDGADEQQYNADGSEINWFDCMDGSQIWISQVNDGNHDCSDGDDEMLDHDDEHMGPYYYENCAESDQGLSTLDCWDNEWDVDGDGVPEDSDSYWNYECQQLADGSWECMTDHINYYDNCAYEGENYYECWLDEWDTDGDGAYDLGSDGYMDYECELLEDGRWACSHSEDMDMFQVYDQCSDATGDYECWMNDWVDSEGNVIMTDGYPLGDCTQLEDGTWECLVMEDDDEDDDLPSEEDFFSGADADNDGYVSAQDIVDFLLSGSGPTPEELLSVADSDGSEGISWEEFVADWNSNEDIDDPEGDHLDNNAQLESDLHAAFDESDTNLDGELSIDEIQAFIDQVIDITSDGEDMTMITELYTMLVNCIDTDGDSLLDQMEFSDFYMTISGNDDDNGMLVFCMFDADGDGQVTDSEYTDYLNTSNYDNGGEPMTEEEWESYVMMFNQYDIDESGGLDFSEFETMIMDGDDGHDHGDGPTFICGDGEEIPFDYVNDGEEDCTDGADEQQYDADGNEINWFDCMDGSQIWISQVNDGNHDCSDGDDEMLDHGGDGDGDGHDHGGDGDGDGHDHGGDGDGDGHDHGGDGDGDGHDHGGDGDGDGHDHGGDGDGDGHDHGGDGDGDGHDHGGEMMAPLDWGIDTADMMTDVSMIEGAFDDYSIVLALCTMDEDSMDEEDMMMGAPSMTCGDDVLKISIADAMMEGASVGFHDADASGTITSGDMIHISPDYEADQPWNTVRLHSTSADKYSDENPMLPGFGVVAGLVALISAAMIARRD